MLDLDFLQQVAIKIQTNIENVIREYCQNLFLQYFYGDPRGNNFLFKGGTALRIVFKSPRYSEDLDFSANTLDDIEGLLTDTLFNLQDEGLSIKRIEESKPTTGGYISIIEFTLPYGRMETTIKLNIKLKQDALIPSSTLIQHDFGTPYTLVYLAESGLVGEKLAAFQSRVKARDYFDLYFILKSDRLRQYIDKATTAKSSIIERLKVLTDRDLDQELKRLLPVGYHNIFIGGFTDKIRTEVEKYL